MEHRNNTTDETITYPVTYNWYDVITNKHKPAIEKEFSYDCFYVGDAELSYEVIVKAHQELSEVTEICRSVTDDIHKFKISVQHDRYRHHNA